MQCLVLVKFLPGCTLPPEEFFARINAYWSQLVSVNNHETQAYGAKKNTTQATVQSAVCIADYDSIEQLTMDLSVTPGAGISSIEVIPLSTGMEYPKNISGILLSGNDWH